MTINLADYVNKVVTATTRNGSTEFGTVKYNNFGEYPYTINGIDYEPDGKWVGNMISPMDIVKIEEYVPPAERYCESCQYWENGYCDFPNTTESENEMPVMPLWKLLQRLMIDQYH
jgi:hypothetical protein